VRKPQYSDHDLAGAVAVSRNISQVLKVLKLHPRGANYEGVRRRISALGIDCSHFHSRSRLLAGSSDAQIRDAVLASRSFAQTLARLGEEPSGGAQAALRRRISRIGVDTSHFKGQGWRQASTQPVVPRQPLTDILVKGRFCTTSHLKRRLISEGLKPHQCEVCARSTWNRARIPLELDHVNGRRDDNRLENLRLLCPNCHAQTPTYRGKNQGAAAGIL
jgi:5-methylcytosine-specific restriction endonuclease McrA